MPNDLGPLFHYPNRAGWKESTTSKDAAEKIEAKGRAKKLERRALAWYAAGNSGTSDECAKALHESPFSIRPRISQLYKRHELERSGVMRRNDSGSPAHVMRLTTIHHQRAAG